MKQINNETPEMIFVEGGTFQMGDTVSHMAQPIHSVTLSDFFIAKYQVTQGLWESVMGQNLFHSYRDDDLPVERVSWYDAVEFCNELSEKQGLQKVYSIDMSQKDPNNHNEDDHVKWQISCDFTANGYRLPTEAEWEYAAKGGSLSKGYPYSSSDHDDVVARSHHNKYSRPSPTKPVGEKKPNELGLYDMNCNVWCWDWLGFYSADSQTNPTGRSWGSYRVNRGGRWNNSASHLPPAYRKGNNPDCREDDLGFRIVRSKFPVSRPINHIKSEDLLKMVNVEGGTFQMGKNILDQKPVHNVTLSDFLIAKYAITQGLWKSVMGINPSNFTGDDNLPVERVSWYDAVKFCNKLSEKEGLQKVYSSSGNSITMNMNANGYRLPTEAEWEYAARGGSLSKGYEYSGSNNAGDVAWFEDNSGSKTHPVGRKQPNELGIYDMSGNVSEWCWDWYDDYSSESQTNPTGPSEGTYRVLRGGSWDYEAGLLRPADRDGYRPDSRDSDGQGFRVVRSKYPVSQHINHIKPEDLLKMVNVEGGTFQMGNNNGYDNEKPLRSVILSDFLIGKYAVTQGLWKSVMGSNPSNFTGDDNLPVENVSWYDAVEFCNKLSEKKGLQKVYRGSGHNITMNLNANGYRLPTEAEWEYAAKGGRFSKGCTYSGSNNAEDVAWYSDNSDKKTHPVGQKQPNELGIYDMSGNVWEWCWDWYDRYSSDTQTNPTGPVSGSRRVFRGGSWEDNAGSLRPAIRVNSYPDRKCNYRGFRLLRSK